MAIDDPKKIIVKIPPALPCFITDRRHPVIFPAVEGETILRTQSEDIDLLYKAARTEFRNSPYLLIAHPSQSEDSAEQDETTILSTCVLAYIMKTAKITLNINEDKEEAVKLSFATLDQRFKLGSWIGESRHFELFSWEIQKEGKPSREEFISPEFKEKFNHLSAALSRFVAYLGSPKAFILRSFNENTIGAEIDRIAAAISIIPSSRLLTPLKIILEELNISRRIDLLTNLIEKILKNPALFTNDLTADEPPKQISRDREARTDSSSQTSRKRYEEIKSRVPEEAQKEIERELIRLGRDRDSLQSRMVSDHLELLLDMPWGVYTEDTKDLRDVKKMLDEDHWGLEKVKNRILEFIAVRQLNPSAKSPILCFIGPPGVGKTSLGQSIARSLGRKFTRLSLGGVRDEAEIRGHRGTYVNAKAGRIIEALRRCKSANPVFMLDEIEKLEGGGGQGDPAAALLEVLDPEQNNKFLDHCLDVHFDLSRIFFITTANILDTILPALHDRMEIIELPGYTPLEKVSIAQLHLIKRRRAENGFPIPAENSESIDVTFTDGALLKLIHHYTLEAGVRSLEREIDKAFRTIAKQVGFKELTASGIIKITEQNVHKYCGKPISRERILPDILPPGVMPVLAASETGGHVFAFEVSVEHHPGERKIKMIGVRESRENKDSVNKIEESFQKVFAGFTARNGILFDAMRQSEDKFGPLLITGNVTEGAIPKDGPSAGLPIFIATYGKLTNQSIKPAAEIPLTAATGQIELQLDGVGAIGGLRDKILAAHRHNIRRCIIPKANESDLEDIPAEILSQMEIKLVHTKWEALLYAFPNDPCLAEFISKQNS